MKYLFQFELKNKKELDALLANDPYAGDSFARLGYVLKESNAIGLKGGFLVLFFSTSDEKRGKKLVELLKTISTCTEIQGSDKEKALKIIESEEDNAASGFGSIFN